MKLYVVHTIIGDYCEEESRIGQIIGVYTDPEVARKVSIVTHGDWVTEINLDYITKDMQNLITSYFKS